MSAQLPPFSGSTAPEGRGVPVVLDPFTSPPRGSTVVDWSFFGAVQPGQSRILIADDGLDALVVQLNQELRIAWIGFDSVDPIATVYAHYSLLVNGNPLAGYWNQPLAYGTTNAPANVVVHVPGPARVQVQVTNEFPGTLFGYTARMVGWMYQQERG